MITAQTTTRFKVFQAMWAMERLSPPGRPDPGPENKIGRIAGAGFDGIAVSVTDRSLAESTVQIARDHSLRWIASCFPASVDDLKRALDVIAAIGTSNLDHINVQPEVRRFTIDECVPFVLAWEELARDAGLPLHLETHRGRMTTDLRFTLQLLDALPEIKLTADLSHYVVGQEFRIPISDEDNNLIERILKRTWAYHGRVASREQVQLQIGFPQHRPWVEIFRAWWREGFCHWLRMAPPNATLTFTCELGPPEYAMTGPDGAELSDRWSDALQLKAIASELWMEAFASVG